MNEQGKKAEEELQWVTNSGTVINEEIAEQMAEEFERGGLDPAKLERRYVAREAFTRYMNS